MERNWFFSLLAEEVRVFDDVEVEARLENFRRDHPEYERKEFVRRWVEFRLRQTGLVYGTPLASEEEITKVGRTGYSLRWAVFLAVLRIEASLAMEIGSTVSRCTRGNLGVGDLLVCFALLCREFAAAEKIHKLIPRLSEEGKPPRKLLRLSAKVGRTLARRAYLGGNPLLGLPIHNSFNYIAAKTLGRVAVAYFEHKMPDRKAIDRVLDYQDQERELLLSALLALNRADRPVSGGSERVMIDQIRSSGLARRIRRTLMRMIREPTPPMVVAAAIQNDRIRDFLVEQLILGAVLDGYFSERESNFIGDLASWTGVSPESLAEREARVIDFYQRHKSYLDAFMVGNAVQSYRQRMLGLLRRSLVENLGLIVEEIKGTGELAELLYRASTGDKLSRDEKAKIRRQLLDILRSIPSLAIFSLPGGAVLLPLLFKILPAGLKPRTFVERERRREPGGNRDLI